jgi:hypothetical protein
MRAAAPALLALLLACAPLQGVRAWGAPGHMTIAALAERHLSAGAAASAANDLAVFKALYPAESEFVTQHTQTPATEETGCCATPSQTVCQKWNHRLR